ncbi:MAG: plastocyanin/azurin family copper-binding protein [Candidatus Nitrosopolaris sp.]
MSINLNNYKFYTTTVIAVLAMAILLSGIDLAHHALGQSKTSSVLIVKGASNPTATEPYNPSSLSIPVGTTVTWTNSDNTEHTVTQGNPSGNTPQNGFDSGLLAPGKTFTHTFDTIGTIQYYCTLHPTMLGEVIVK